jgi:uncharacterized protein (TIGR03437 family)
MATACLATPACRWFNIINPNDANSWTDGFFPGFGEATLFDRNFQPKPAYHALINVLRQAALAVPTAPKLTPAAVANAASYSAQGVAPGEIVALFPANVGPPTLVGTGLDSSGRILTRIGGTRVLFDGIAAPMIYTLAGQVAAIVPYEVAGKTSTLVQVEYNDIRSVAVAVPVVDAAPGIFTANASGTGQAALINQDGSLNSATNPAERGSVAVFYATGEGQRNPPGVTGALSGANAAPVLPVSLTVGGAQARIFYAASAPGFAGLMQVNFEVPQGAQPGPAVPVTLRVGNRQSASVTMAVR